MTIQMHRHAGFTALIASGLALAAGCSSVDDTPGSHEETASTPLSKTGREVPDGRPTPERPFVPDPIDALTGEQWDADGRAPPRVEDLGTPSYALLKPDALWREIEGSSRQVFILVKSAREHRGFFKGKRLVGTEQVARTKAEMLATIPGLRELRDERLDSQPARTSSGMEFPGFYATIDSYDALLMLRERADLDYVEPRFFFSPQSGGGFPPFYVEDLTTPGLQDEKRFFQGKPDIVPYTFKHMGITDAWDRFSSAPGAGVRLAVLDTGMSTQQDQLQGRFVFGASRPAPSHFDATGTGLEDSYQHGTKIAALIAAPKDGRSIAGALWGSPLTTVKVANAATHFDGFTSGSVCGGVNIAVAANARITMMAFGFAFASPVVRECIANAFDTTSMIFVAAAGTSVPLVVFPATMNREVIAVSVVEVKGTKTYEMFGSGISYGPDVDFVAAYGHTKVPVSGGIGNDAVQDIVQGGGTSIAVPHVAAVFGFAIQGNPGWSRADIVSRVRSRSSTNNVSEWGGQPLPANAIGSGIPNAYAAAGGASKVDLIGPARVQVGQPFVYEVTHDAQSTLTHDWFYSGPYGTSPLAVGSVVTFPAQPTPGTFSFIVRSQDHFDGRTLYQNKTVQVVANPVPPPTIRQFSSASVVYHNPSWSQGGRFDQTVNPGVLMAPGCEVTMKRAHLQCWNNNSVAVDCTNTNDEITAHYGGRGFTVDPAIVNPRDLGTPTHYWHDGFNGVSVRIKYTVRQPAGVVCDVPGFTQP